MARKHNRIVYSTDGGRDRQDHEQPRPPQRRSSTPPAEQTVGVRREKKGRRGKTVTVVVGLQLTEADLKTLAKALKRRCGSGGTAKQGRIEIQGDHVETVIAALGDLGYGAKRVGG